MSKRVTTPYGPGELVEYTPLDQQRERGKYTIKLDVPTNGQRIAHIRCEEVEILEVEAKPVSLWD